MGFDWSAIRYFDWASIRSLDRAKKRDIVLVSVAALLLCIGTCRLACSSGPEAPSGEAAYVYFRCEECGARFHLTPEELDDKHRTRSSGRALTDPLRVRCKECGKPAGLRDAQGPSPP
jgi:hypothetical protein